MTQALAISEELLEDGLDDWNLVDSLIALAYQAGGEERFRTLFRQSLDWLLENQYIEAGTLEEEGFRAWVGAPKVIAERVVKLCESLEWQPMGDGCWLSNTASGDAYARAHRS
ncbi:hypothetical protein [Streptomyces sp. NRRL F-5126]|uniref:hypothetical protein n=1 Tax=Streptomyces sp. NRRL F-5126 TaxID=1463857 RepID=UPI0004CBEC9F|nr:hypothetical protein [Streptomyces sp. NRRL F-5126]